MSQDQWNAVLLFGTLLAGAFTFIVYWRQQRNSKRELSYGYEEAKIQDSPISDLRLTFKGETVSDVSVITLYIRNSGRLPIPRGDFETPITFDVQAGAMFLAEVSKTLPADLKTDLTLIRSTPGIEPYFQVGPMLFNPGDEITMLILASSFKGLKASGRILGVKSIGRVRVVNLRGLEREIGILSAFIATFIATLILLLAAAVFHFPRISAIRSATIAFLTEWVGVCAGFVVGRFLLR